MYVVISWYSDGSGKPHVAFCESADQAIATVAEETTGGAMTTTYEIEDNLSLPAARLVYGPELRDA